MRESGHFSSIDSKILVGQENSEDAYFALHVTEKPSLTLDTALAFSTDQLLSVEFELEENNLFSSMLRLNTNLGIGLFWGRQSFISNKFVWPFIFGGPFRFSLQAPVIIYDDKTSQVEPFRRLQSKVIASLEWRASPILMPYLRYSLTHTLRENFPNDIVPEISTQEHIRSIDGLIPVLHAQGKIRGMIKPGISLINLDNPTDPHSGIDLNNFVELSGGPLVGDPFFINLGTQNKFYIPLGSTTLALQLSLMRAFITPSSNNWKELSEVSAMDNLGGDRRVRGYQEGAIRPAHAISDPGQYGGYLLNSSSIEWRFPLTSPELLGNFSGALFVDQGLVVECKNFVCGDHVSWNELVARKEFGLSVGVGIRYNLPVGPISLDFAYSPLHNDWRPHLQFGYAF
ncbi:MAG: Translocation and assembly module TamA precursor [bacterium ADurb.BinA186]|nr:MAG: Translocation and assembly module TamA precursor [bacterium ADurb.BinA186]